MDLNSSRFVLQGTAYPLIPYIDSPKTIVDCGGNAGATACFLARAYPEARILSFEPSAGVYAYHRENTAQFPQIEGHPFGLSNEDQSITLYGGRESTVTQSTTRNSYTTDIAETVHLRDARAALKELGVQQIDILKIDTQGAELQIMRALADLIPQCSVIYAEYHSESDRLEIDQMLSPTHMMVSARIEVPHIGEISYVNTRLYWEKGDLGHYQIGKDQVFAMRKQSWFRRMAHKLVDHLIP